jgi:hypothetical protein
LVLIPGCAQPMSADSKSTARQGEQLYKYEGRDVTLVGHTRLVDTERYKGAAVELDDGTQVRVPEVSSWPTFTTGDVITIRGRLRRYTPLGRPARIPANGSHSKRCDGRRVTWRENRSKSPHHPVTAITSISKSTFQDNS